MKQLLTLLLYGGLSYPLAAQAQCTILDLQQQAVAAASLQDHRTLVIILPLQQDTAIVGELVRFQQLYGDSVRTIGLLCLAPCQALADSLIVWYAPAAVAGVVLATGIENTDPADHRGSVLKWLFEKNLHNRPDEPGLTGSKYFLSRRGRLYAQAGTAAALDGQLVQNLLRVRVPGE